MDISVIGCGRWGTFLAWYLDKINNNVTLYGRPSSENMKRLTASGGNGTVTLNQRVTLETDLEKAARQEILLIATAAQQLRAVMQELTAYRVREKRFILCMKGIEIPTGKRLTEVVAEYTGDINSSAVWLGPGHVQELYAGIPNCMVIDSADREWKRTLVNAFSSDLIRFYYGSDLIGNEIGGAAKNVIGIAAGMLDGLGLTSLKGALMSRGTREIARLIHAMGGNELSAYGLCHLGDYEATVFSKYSLNRRFGEALIKGEPFSGLAEGYYTVKALMRLARRYPADLPICGAVHEVLYEGADPKDSLARLFLRSLKREF